LIIHIFHAVDVLFGLQKIKFQYTPLASELRIHVALQESLGVLPNHRFCHQRALNLTEGREQEEGEPL
jgi:hypothetical protein